MEYGRNIQFPNSRSMDWNHPTIIHNGIKRADRILPRIMELPNGHIFIERQRDRSHDLN
jgi:hypothetical protein